MPTVEQKLKNGVYVSASAITPTSGDVPIGNGSSFTSAIPSSTAVSGTLVSYCGATLPTGYLWCDGDAVSRTTYANLFTAIGTAYGVGDGSTTFNVPDMRTKIAMGANPMYSGGPSLSGATAYTFGQQPGALGASVTVQTGVGVNVLQATNTLQPSLISGYIIKT